VSLTVTTHRVRETLKGRGVGQVTSIMLDEVTGCEVAHLSRPTLLYVAALSVVAGVAGWMMQSDSSGQDRNNGGPALLFLGIVVAVVLVAAYFATRKNVVRVSSASTKIEVPLTGVGFDKAVEVIDVVESAKNEHYWMRKSVVAVQPAQQAASVAQAWATAPQG
jgi:uncharacterized membrane protein